MLQPKKLVLHKELCLGSFLLNVLIGTVIGFAIEFIPDGYFEPYRRGFYCNDSSIQLPYKFNTVSTSALHAFVFLPPFAGILITEVYRSKYYKELYSWRGFNINQILIYLQSRISHKNLAIVLKPLVQLSVISMSLFIGYSRIIDGLHHLHDVIVGFLVGTLIGYITAKYIAGLRMRPDEMRRNEMKLQKVELSSVPPDETTPSYKTSVVRIEPTELRLFD
uniref:Phosphatidic acid phosphatase type 2/haloperoxidase domain-containing protein n=1 Tax=Setaria digitata TaxID=48799 RepID=A0A915Q471_9BILA